MMEGISYSMALNCRGVIPKPDIFSGLFGGHLPDP